MFLSSSTPSSEVSSPPNNEDFPHAELATHMLTDIGPELCLSWILSEASKRNPRNLPPVLHRGLISYLLRAASQHEARAASDALHASLRMPQRNRGACLGFSIANRYADFAPVLLDILQSAARAAPLLPSGKALDFYSRAGPGSVDTEDFHTATPEARVPFCDEHERLSGVRAYNLLLCIRYLTAALGDNGTYSLVQDVANGASAPFLAPLVTAMPEAMGELDPKMIKGILSFYSVYMKSQPKSIRDNLKARLMNATMRVGKLHEEIVGTYLGGFDDVDVRFTVTRLCLIQRFKVNDRVDSELTVGKLLKKYLVLKPVQGRVNIIVPALTAVMIMAWYEHAPLSAFKYDGQKKEVEKKIVQHIDALYKVKHSFPSSFGVSKRSRNAFRVAILMLANRVMDANEEVFGKDEKLI